MRGKNISNVTGVIKGKIWNLYHMVVVTMRNQDSFNIALFGKCKRCQASSINSQDSIDYKGY